MVDLSKIAKSLKEKYKTSSVAEDVKDPTDFVSTGNLAFDLISEGGIPFGYLVELLGLSRSGKSLIIQRLIANAQKEYNAIGILVDRENAYTKRRGEELGIDNSRLLLVKPMDTPLVKDAFGFMLQSIDLTREQDKDAYIVLAVDSISAFDKDVTLEKSDSGRKAKSIHEALRKMLPSLDSKMMLIVANQVIWNVGVVFGDRKASTAGESMKYYSTIRFALEDKKRIEDEKKGGEVIGNWLGIEVIKTRLGPCYRTCYVPFYYDERCIPYYGGYARLLAERNYLLPRNKKDFKSMKTHTLLFGEEKVNEFEIEDFLKKHPELRFDRYPGYRDEDDG